MTEGNIFSNIFSKSPSFLRVILSLVILLLENIGLMVFQNILLSATFFISRFSKYLDFAFLGKEVHKFLYLLKLILLTAVF